MSKKRGGLGKGRGARIRQGCSEFSRRVRGKQREKSVCREDKAGGRAGQSLYHSSVLRTGGGTVSAEAKLLSLVMQAGVTSQFLPAKLPSRVPGTPLQHLPQPQRCRRLSRRSRRTARARPTGGVPHSGVTCGQATPQRISNTFPCV